MPYFVLLLIMGKDAHLKTESFFFVMTLKNGVTRTF